MAKTPANWIPTTSGTVTAGNTGIKRLTQTGVVRLDQNGVVRTLQPNVVVYKKPATWSGGV